MIHDLLAAHRRAVHIAVLVLGSWSRPVHAGAPQPGTCAPPRTVVALLPFADQTDRAWESWTGENPTRLVARLVADSLEQGLGRSVLLLASSTPGDTNTAPRYPLDDERALLAARAARAEVVIIGTVSAFTHDDHREAGRLGRWGVGAPDSRSRIQVRVSLRVLDAADGSVIIESTAARDRSGRGTASASRPYREAGEPPPDSPLRQALGEVLGDLSRTIGQRLDARWQARVIQELPGVYVLDAGSARGLFMGERLEVWRSGFHVYDENLMRVEDHARVGALVVVALDGHGRARARLADGAARRGDVVRPCFPEGGPALSLRR